MLRPLLMFGASAALALSLLTSAEAQPGRGGGRGGPGFGGPGAGPGIGIQFGNQNRGFNNGFNNPGWNQRGNPGIYYGTGNLSIWYSPYSSWNAPMSARGGYYGPTYVVPAPTVTTVVPASAEMTPQYGLQVTRVFEGGAKKADLRQGDVILGVGKTRTESFEALQAALVGAKEVEIVFLNNESKKVEKLPVKVDDGKLGIEVVPVAMQ